MNEQIDIKDANAFVDEQELLRNAVSEESATDDDEPSNNDSSGKSSSSDSSEIENEVEDIQEVIVPENVMLDMKRNRSKSNCSVSSHSHAASTKNVQATIQSNETKTRKIWNRVLFGFFMIVAFGCIIWAGHLYVCMLVVILQSMVFKEIVNVRYNLAKEKEITLFRTLQWSWFAVAVFYTYGDFLHGFVLEHRELLWLAPITNLHAGVSFSLYCCIFVLSVLTLKKGYYKYQVGQLTWTIVTICMIVAQLKFVAHNIFSGLFWFFFPCSLVICNDIFAYFCGITLGRKIIKAPFLKISPNKTWEGFIGAMFLTVILAFFLAGYLTEFKWFTCPVERLSLGFEGRNSQLHCKPDSVFQVQEIHLPEQILRFSRNFLFVNLSRVLGRTSIIAKPIQLHAVVMASFTSLIAPFGGFWASAIKRTYGIKDFDSIIPGHGGVTDRMDCQFITALFVSVYYRTFIRTHAVTVGSILAQISLLSREEMHELFEELAKTQMELTENEH